jgi:hypothetical protein
MKRLPFTLLLSFFLAALSSTFVGCGKTEAPPIARDAGNAEVKVAASDLHPCDVTGSRLTKEDCNAARDYLNRAKKGTAAISVPTWMLQGQTKVVTLAVGTMPPPEATANKPPKPEPNSSTPKSESPSQPEPTGSPQPEPHLKANLPPKTPHEVAAQAGDPKKTAVVDYFPFVGQRMTANLAGEGFDIKPLFERSDQTLVDNAITTWEWQITAKDFGKKTLVVKTNVVMINSRGSLEHLTPTTEYKEIVVYIGVDGIFVWINSLPDWLKAIAAILVGVSAVVGAWKSLQTQFDRKEKEQRTNGDVLTKDKSE